MTSKVVILKTNPNTVIEDYSKLMDLASYRKAIKTKELILKLNLSWSLYYPACSTEPWQLDGVLKKLYKHYNVHAVENRTVVTDPMKGAKLNKWLPVLENYNLKFTPLTDVKWVNFHTKKYDTPYLDSLFQGNHKIPEMFVGKSVLHLPTLKCVHPETEIFLGDGSLVKIGDIIKDVHNKKEPSLTREGDKVSNSERFVNSINQEGKIVVSKATHFWETPVKEKVVYLKTKTKKEIKVSLEHPFLTQRGWVKARDLNKKDRIAIPRIIKIKGKSQKLPEIKKLNHQTININQIKFKGGYKYSPSCQKEIIKRYIGGETITKITKSLKIPCETIRSIIRKNNVDIRWARNWVKVPQKTSQDFWRWWGYFTAEGFANDCNGTTRFWWSNEDKKISSDYIDLTKSLFGVDIKIREKQGKSTDFYFDSNNLKEFFKKMGISFPILAYTKDIPSLLYKCPDKEIASFIQGYFDGDGTVSKNEISITSKSNRIIKHLHLIFLRLGIMSFTGKVLSIATNGRMKSKETYYTLQVYAKESQKFKRYISLKSENKKRNLKELIERRKNSKNPSNWDTIPISPLIFRKVREGLRFTQISTGKPSSVSSIENDYSKPTQEIMAYFIDLFKKRDYKNEFKDEIDYMRLLTSKEIAWDHIKEIRKIKSDVNYFCDLSIKDNENFIGNGIIVHNTHGHTKFTGSLKNAFGGLITKRRHHSHKIIDEILVDLLKVQREIHPSIFTVTDGTISGNGAGPRTMDIVQSNLILASDDPVAIDAVSAKIMGFEPEKIKFLKMAHEQNLGNIDLKQIDIIGEDINKINLHSKPKKSPVVYFDQVFRKKYPILEPLLFHTPLFNLCILASAVYHDHLWYPTIGKKKIKQFKKTSWGRLFETYQ